MHPTWKSVAIAIAKFTIPAAIIGWLLWRIEPVQWDELSAQPKNYVLLMAALLVALTSMSLSFARWCVLVRCQGIELSMLEAFRLGSIGFLLSFVSAGSVGGDLFKAIFLAQRRPGKRIEAVASVLVDRGAGLYALLLLVTAALLTRDPSESFKFGGQEMARIKLATVVLVTLGTVSLAFLVLGGRSVDRFVKWAGTWPLIGGLVERVGRPLRMFHSHSIAFAASLLMSLGVQSMLVVSMYLVARGLYVSPPTLAEHFVIVPIGMLASALPITPAGLGLLEAAVDWLYQVVPAITTEASGTLVALVFEIVKVVMAAIGVLFYWTANQEVIHSIEIAEEESAGGHESPPADAEPSQPSQ